MRRLAAASLVMVMVLSLGAASTSAKSAAPLNRRVSGPFRGSTTYDLFTSRCSLVHQVLDGTYTTANGGSGSFHVDVCPLFGTGGGTVDSGTFTVRDPKGATLEGTVTGVYRIGAPPTIPFEFELHVASGTNALRRAHGTISMSGVWVFEANPAPISGTLDGAHTR